MLLIPVVSQKEKKKDLKMGIMKAADPNVFEVKYLLNWVLGLTFCGTLRSSRLKFQRLFFCGREGQELPENDSALSPLMSFLINL